MRFNKELIEKINNEIDLVSLVSEDVKLEKRGMNYVGLCPFHSENTPSFSVNTTKQLAYCFGCKKGGSPIQYYMEIKNKNFEDAVVDLGQKVGVKIQPSQNNVDSFEMKMIKMTEFLVQLYHNILIQTQEGEQALQYLTDRGFNEKLIKSEQLGFTPKKSDFTVTALKQKGFNLELAHKAGLISRNEDNFSYYDRFVNRVMIPIKNHQGYLIGFTARAIDGSEPKYINTQETPIFKKRELLFNLSSARKDIRKKDEVIMMEGHLDVLKVKMTNIQNIVASMGTALSDENITTLRKLSNNITFMYDGDKSGQRSQLESGIKLLKEGMDVYVIRLPEGEDPDSLIESMGIQSFETYVMHNKQSFIAYETDVFFEESKGNEQQFTKSLNILIKHTKLLKNDIAKSRAIQHIAKTFEVEPEFLQNLILKENSSQPKKSYQKVQHNNSQAAKEKLVLKGFINDKTVHDELVHYIDREMFSIQPIYDIITKLTNYYLSYDYMQLSLFMDELNDQELTILSDIHSIHIGTYLNKEVIYDYIQDLSGNNYYKYKKRQLEEKLYEARLRNDLDEISEVMNDIIELQKNFKT